MKTKAFIDNKRALARIARLLKNVDDKRPAFRSIARSLLTRIRFCFRTSTSPYGERWPAVARDGQPLRDSGRLQRSITQFFNNELVEVGTNTSYAKVHNFGFDGPVNVRAHMRTIQQAFGRPIPARQVAVRTHTRLMKVQQRRFMPIRDDGRVELPRNWVLGIIKLLKKHVLEGV